MSQDWLKKEAERSDLDYFLDEYNAITGRPLTVVDGSESPAS